MKRWISIAALNELVRSGKVVKRHTSLCPGWLPTSWEPREAWAYKGKYGRGWTVDKPARTAEQYHFRTYYIYKGTERAKNEDNY